MRDEFRKTKALKKQNIFRRTGQRFLKINDTPNAIALGVAAGMLLGFTPLFGLKTLLAIGFAWAIGGNKIAAAITVTLHDVLLPIFPVILRVEYDIGFWLLSHPHELPPHLDVHQHGPETWMRWSTFFSVGSPLLVGSVLFATPFAVFTFFIVRWALERRLRNQDPVFHE